MSRGAAVDPMGETERICPECRRALHFCERCGDPHAAAPFRSLRGRIHAFANVAGARRDPAHRDSVESLHPCPGCGRYVGDECWNPVARHCLDCRPAAIFEGRRVSPALPLCSTCGVPGSPGTLLPRAIPRRPAAAVLGVAGVVVAALVALNLRPAEPSLAGSPAVTGGVAAATATAAPVASAQPSATPTSAASPTVAATATPEPVAVEIVRSAARAWRDEFGSVFAHVLVEARNPGPGAVQMRGVDARYAITGSDGAVLHRGAFVYALPTIVPEGESAYFVDTVRLDFAQSTDLGTVEVEIGPAARTGAHDVSLVVSDVTWERRLGDGLEVSGTVRNPLDASVATAMVAVVLLGSDGEMLGAVYDATDIGDIPPGGVAEFSADYPRTPPLDPAAVGSVRAVAFALSAR